jgi:HSP20 family molecular chaperone IbpA
LSANWRDKRYYDQPNRFKEKLSKKFNLSRESKRNRRRILKKNYPDKYKLPRIYRGKRFRPPLPLIDVLEEIEEIVIIAGFAGIPQENLEVHLNDQRLTLIAHDSDRKYHKYLNLPQKVVSSNIHTKYKNGVLEIRLKKESIQKSVN